jgi:hypothetical protein
VDAQTVVQNIVNWTAKIIALGAAVFFIFIFLGIIYYCAFSLLRNKLLAYHQSDVIVVVKAKICAADICPPPIGVDADAIYCVWLAHGDNYYMYEGESHLCNIFVEGEKIVAVLHEGCNSRGEVVNTYLTTPQFTANNGRTCKYQQMIVY